MKRAASAAQLPTTAGGAITSAGPPPTRAGEVGEDGGGLAEAHVEGEAAAELDGVEEAEPAERLGLVRAQLADEALGRGDRRGRRGGGLGSSRSVTQPLPSTVRPAPKGVPSSPTTWRRISAPVSWSAPARSARAAAASLRSTRSSSTHLPCERTSGRASAARRATSAAVSSTSSNTADQRTSLSWLAPTTVSPVGSTKRRSAGRRLAARQRRHPHLEAGRLEGGAGDGHELPRLVLAQVHLAPPEAARPAELVVEALEPDDLVGEVLRALAVGEGLLDREQPALGTAAEHRQEPGVAAVGRVELDDERGLGHAAHLVRPLVEPLRHLGAGGDRARVNGEPSRRATKASPTSAALRITGGVAGRSSFSPASSAMASTTAPITSRVTVRGSLRESTATGPGHGARRAG